MPGARKGEAAGRGLGQGGDVSGPRRSRSQRRSGRHRDGIGLGACRDLFVRAGATLRGRIDETTFAAELDEDCPEDLVIRAISDTLRNRDDVYPLGHRGGDGTVMAAAYRYPARRRTNNTPAISSLRASVRHTGAAPSAQRCGWLECCRSPFADRLSAVPLDIAFFFPGCNASQSSTRLASDAGLGTSLVTLRDRAGLAIGWAQPQAGLVMVRCRVT